MVLVSKLQILNYELCYFITKNSTLIVMIEMEILFLGGPINLVNSFGKRVLLFVIIFRKIYFSSIVFSLPNSTCIMTGVTTSASLGNSALTYSSSFVSGWACFSPNMGKNNDVEGSYDSNTYLIGLLVKY